MKNIFGEVSWQDTVIGEGTEKKVPFNKDLYLKLEKGSNIVRIVTPPHQYVQHKWKPEGDPGFGYRVMCSSVHGSCPLCAKGDKPKRRWYLGVIDRKTNTYKLLDISVSVFKSIQSLVKDEDWGDPNKYDVDIKVDQAAGPAGYYTVNPKPHKALSANDLQIKEKVDMEELKRKVSPPTPDKVQERLDKILQGGLAIKPGAGVAATAAPVSKAKKAAVDLSNDDEEFPDYDNKPSPF